VPRYFFHVCNGDGFTQDEEGAILPDPAAARRNAIAAARGIMADEMRAGQLNPASFIEIEDEVGKLLFTLQFSEAYEVRQKPGRGPEL
jgi:hypothetical protein